MFKKLIDTVKKEKTQSSVSETLDQRLKEIPDVQGKQQITVNNNKLIENEEVVYAKQFNLDINEFSSPVQNLEQYKVEGINTLYYIQDYITVNDEKNINDEIYDLPNKTWVNLPYSNRRLQKWGGNVTQNGLEDQKTLPPFLEALSVKLFDNKISPKKPNHVLLNEYQKGVGIMPHTDGPLYYPWVNSISMGSTCIFKFFKDMDSFKEGKEEGRLLLERRSLVIFTEQAYHEFMHTIDDLTSDIILLSIDEETSNNNGFIKIISSNILNFSQTNLKRQLESLNLEQALKDEVILKVKENEEYNYCIELPRDKRISLTIRNVPSINQPAIQS